MRAFNSALAEALPLEIKANSRSLSSAVKSTV
jgi:hypothetical protein